MADTIKALVRSQKMPPVCSQWSNEVRLLSLTVMIAFPLVFLFLNPHHSGMKILFAFRYWFNLWNINVYKILLKVLIMELFY